MPGPTKLGSNVLHVDVDKGAYPTSKSTEYTGKATLSKNGTVFLDDVKLEKFGVRGTSTADVHQEAVQAEVRQEPQGHGRLRHGC